MSRLDEIVSSLKISWALIATSFASNASLAIGLIPENIGKVGVLITTFTAIVVLTVQVKRLGNENKESIIKDLEIEKLRLSIEADRRTHARRTEDEIN